MSPRESLIHNFSLGSKGSILWLIGRGVRIILDSRGGVGVVSSPQSTTNGGDLYG
jgi:hypothetical protein